MDSRTDAACWQSPSSLREPLDYLPLTETAFRLLGSGTADRAEQSLDRHRPACTLGVVRYHDPALPCVLQPIARSVSLVFFKQIFQYNIVQHGVCQKALQLSVLILQRFKAVGVRNVHSRDIAARPLSCSTCHRGPTNGSIIAPSRAFLMHCRGSGFVPI
jgi:hypothetical protein